MSPRRTGAKRAINVRLDDSLPSEGYTLLITPDSIDIAGGSPAGVFYAFQSLRQLLPAAALAGERARVIELPAVEIRDEPHFAYRGAMLDACRHFFKPDEVKEYLDLLALHKINRFHWHLTDDQGWRIEIKKYPELTTVGSVREKDLLTNVLDTVRKFDENPYGGFYTQDQIRDIVKYAADRFITVIPEIEMPGHATAALAAYPYLGCVGKDYKVTTPLRHSGRRVLRRKRQHVRFPRGCTQRGDRSFPVRIYPYRRRRVYEEPLERVPALPAADPGRTFEKRDRAAKLFRAPDRPVHELERAQDYRMGRDSRGWRPLP